MTIADIKIIRFVDIIWTRNRVCFLTTVETSWTFHTVLDVKYKFICNQVYINKDHINGDYNQQQ